MADTITVAVLIGTIRSERLSINPANLVTSHFRQIDGVDVVLVDPRNLQLSDEGEVVKDPAYSEITQNADAFVIVTPEYNHSFPGSLKRMLDSEYANYKHKPVSLVGVSNGSWGGVRVCEALLPVCHRLGLVNIQAELYFPRVQDLFDQSGQLKPEHQNQYSKNLQNLSNELLWFARLLKSGRHS